MKLAKLVFVFLLLFSSINHADGLSDKIDSLFVYASSGEVKYRDLVDPAIDSIAAMGIDAVPHLINKFTTKSARERLTIINILKKIGSPAVPLLKSALKRPEDIVVARVCWALGDIADTSSVTALIQSAQHYNWWVREQAADALGKIMDRRASETIIGLITDEIEQVRKAAVVASGKINIPECIPMLVSAMGDSFYGVRMSAVGVLTKMDTTQVLKHVIDSLNSENHLMVANACCLLGKLGTDEAKTKLYELASSIDMNVRAHASVNLILADPNDECRHHQEILEKEKDYFVKLKIESALKTVNHVSPKP